MNRRVFWICGKEGCNNHLTSGVKTTGAYSSRWYCDICRTWSNDTSQRRLICTNCDYDVCYECYKKKCPTCKGNYETGNRSDGTYSTGWYCDQCSVRDGNTTTNRCMCKNCNLDLCFKCRNIFSVTQNQNQSSGNTGSQNQENQDEVNTCTICADKKVDTVLTSCGHVFCRQCTESVRICPNCRTSISGRMRIYL